MTKQIINVGSGELVGDGEGLRSAFIKVNNNFDEVYADIAAIPTDLSAFNNDVGYITTASVPTNLSELTNDVGYITTASIPTNISVFVNDAGYLTTATLSIPDVLGNLEISGTDLQTISGTVTDGDITITPNGVGTVRVPSLTLPVGSLVEETATIEVVIADLTLDTIVDYSTGPGDTLAIGTVGNPTGIAHPWAIYRFTTTPDPVLQVNDVIGGPAVPVGSTISYVGTGTYDAYIVTDKVFPLGVPVDGATITTTRPVVNASFSIKTNVNTDIALETGGGSGVIVTHSDVIPFTNNSISLGTPTKRFKQLWLGGGTIFIADDVLGIDLAIAARNGDLVVQGGAGLEVGEFVLRDQTIYLTNPAKEIFIGTTGATAPITFNRTIRVRDIANTYDLLDVDQQGRMTVLSDIATDPTQAAMSIVGARRRDVKSPDNLGVLLQLTGSSTAPSRIYHDSYGATNYSAFIGRKARGSSTTSTQTLSGDIIARVGANPHDDVGFASISTMRMDFVNAEDQTTSARGGKIEFWTTPLGSTTIGKRVTIDGSDIVLTALGNGGITFADSTRQTTAWTGTVQLSQVQGLANGAVTRINVGAGLTQTTSTGIVGIDATGVQNIVGTPNRIIVTDSGGKNLTLTTPQDLSTTATVTFQNITVNNLTVLGTSTVAATLAIDGKVIYLATSATDISQIDGGGIVLGTGTFAKSILYDVNNMQWDTNGGGLKTLHLEATTATVNSLYVLTNAHFGTSYLGYDFANADIQADGNINDYLQIVNKNHNTGTNASTDFVAANDIGTDGNNYIDLGINSSVYSNPDYSIGGENDGYLYINGGDLTIGTQSTGTEIRFHTGGTTSDELRATITDAGLTVVGTINGLTLPGTSSTAGWVLSNNGTGTLTWVQPQTGYVGSRGATGFTGSQGIQGTTGFTGSRGTDGVIGYNGSTGYTGSAGAGYTGSKGDTGSTGFTGSQGVGFTGSKGDTGAIGNTGATGFTGSQGDTGSQGTTGFTGSKGDTGAIGNTGVTGFTGSKGDQGNLGYTGSTGAGFTGSAGVGYTGSASTASGYTGSIGFTGSKGDQGSPGYTGSASTVAGFTGSQGSIGNTGYTGSIGVGYAGSKGDQGSPGYTGSAGVGYTGSASTSTPSITSIGILNDGSFTATNTVTNMLFAPGGRMVLNIATGSNVITITDYSKGPKKHRAKYRNGSYAADIDMTMPEDTITFEEGSGILLSTNTGTATLTIATEFTGTLVLTGELVVNPASVSKNAVGTQTFTLTGLSTSHKILVTSATALTYGIFISAAWASSINTVSVQFMNISGSNIDLGNITLTYFAWL